MTEINPENEINITVNGKPAKGIKVDVSNFQLPKEHWNEYMLEDGTVIKLKVILKAVVRIKDHYDQSGNPVYSFQHQTINHIDVPESLKKCK